MVDPLSSLWLLQTGANDELPIDEGTFLLAMAIGLLILLAIAIGIGYWVYRDASKRENNELAWAIGVTAVLFFFFPFGLVAPIAYYFLRGDVAEPAASPDADGEW